MIELGVNIDHVATLRQARRDIDPDPVAAAQVARQAGERVLGGGWIAETQRAIVAMDQAVPA